MLITDSQHGFTWLGSSEHTSLVNEGAQVFKCCIPDKETTAHLQFKWSSAIVPKGPGKTFYTGY